MDILHLKLYSLMPYLDRFFNIESYFFAIVLVFGPYLYPHLNDPQRGIWSVLGFSALLGFTLIRGVSFFGVEGTENMLSTFKKNLFFTRVCIFLLIPLAFLIFWFFLSGAFEGQIAYFAKDWHTGFLYSMAMLVVVFDRFIVLVSTDNLKPVSIIIYYSLLFAAFIALNVFDTEGVSNMICLVALSYLYFVEYRSRHLLTDSVE